MYINLFKIYFLKRLEVTMQVTSKGILQHCLFAYAICLALFFTVYETYRVGLVYPMSQCHIRMGKNIAKHLQCLVA